MFHTLSLFPSFLDFQLFAPLILRIAAGVFLALIGFDSFKHQKLASSVDDGAIAPKRSMTKLVFGIVCAFISLCIIIGLYTQGAALAAILILILNSAFRGRLLNTSGTSGDALLLIIIICIALLLFGAGMPAIDLPL